MTKLKSLTILAVVSALTATPVLAQQAISEPGNYAFFYPNGDLGLGSANTASAQMSSRGSFARMDAGAGSCSRSRRSNDTAVGAFPGYGGMRHSCR